ncbi:hypothetical protein DZD52_10565 [Xanthomonas nasturtii]|uniref:Uncharacterized protein n=1 Tax=Xanthomonas nasturtii TaxID=1843581 RepID=A0A3E1KKH1_9XANT|nr:hypothetical protein DZD52_10565 [Xanthomonas nasturtii]
MTCSSVKRFFTSNLLRVGNWTPNCGATQNRGDVAPTPAESHLTQHSSPGKNRGYRAQSHARVTTPPARRAGLLGSCPCSDVISWP